jgi:hypothetical protein
MTRDVSARATRLPNLIICGVGRAGTTSLFRYLGQHRDVGLSDVKELRYFTPLRYGEPLDSIESYAAHFAGCVGTRYAVEATPGYFYGGAVLARRMRETCPGVHALVSLRSPVERCWSWFGFVKSRLRIPKEMTFQEYLDRCEQLHNAGVDDLPDNQAFWGLGGGCYAASLPGWVEEFGSRFRLVFFDDLVADPRDLVRSTCEWLDLDPDQVQQFQFAVNNKSEQYRLKHLQRIAVTANRHAEKMTANHQDLKKTLRRAYYLVNRRPGEPGMPASQRERLTEFYQPHNAELAKQLADLGLSIPPSW